MPTEEIKIAVLETEMKNLTKAVDSFGIKIDTLTQKIDDSYVKKEDFDRFKRDEFIPVQTGYNKLIWWIIGVLLTSLGALILAVVNYFTAHHVWTF